MADGNVGSLYMTLGLKDEVTVGLNKVAKSLTKSKQYTDELKKEVEGLRKELKGVSGTDMSEPIKKALSFIKKYDDEVYKSINKTNNLAYALRGVFENSKGEIKINLASIPKAISELSKLSNKLDSYGDDKLGANAFKNKVANAIDYLKMLQSIERKQRELNDLAISSRNIDKSDIASAKMMLNDLKQSFAKQLFTKDNSLINTNFMSEVKKVLSMTMTEISDYMRNLKKDNPLSVFVNSADMLTSKISSANKKILEMQSLMRGSKIPNLFDNTAISGLKGIVGQMQALINKEGKGEKTDINKINRLVSEYAKLVSQAELAKSTFKQLSREYDNASARLVSWFSKYRELQSMRNDRIRLGLDTSAIDVEISRVRALVSEINSIRRGLAGGDTNFLGMLGSRGTGVDTNIFNSVRKASREEIAAVEKIDRAIEKSYEKEKRQEQQRSEQRLKDIDREGKALQKNAEIQDRLAAKQESSQRKQSNEALREEYRLRDAKLKQLDREAKIAMKNEEAQRRLSEQQARLHVRISNEITTVSSKVESLTGIYRRLTSEMNRSTLLGIDTSKIQAEMSRIGSQILRLANIKKGLETGDTSYLGAHRMIGTAVDRSAARSVLQEYRDLNSEKEKVIKLEARHQLEIANTAAKVRNDLARAFEQVNTRASKTSDIVRDLKSLFLQGGLVFGAQQFFNSIVRTGGEIVQQHIALRSIIGDIQKADELFAQTQQLALQSPFKFGELNRDVKQLAAFGVEANDLYDTTKRLADIASGLGVSFERLGLAYGQVKARSWLDGKELRQFAYAGLPLLERITQLYNATAKNGRTNYTQSDVKKMITNREVSFEDVKTVLWNMTNEGGQFYNMQLVLSETLLGRWNKLIDAWEIMLGKFAEGNNVMGGTFKMIIDQVTNLTLALDRLSPVLVAAATVLVGKKALGLIPMGITKELSALQTATNLELRRYAVKQQELVAEGKITQAKAAQNVMMRGYMLADKQTQIATMQKLALEGKLSLLQMQKAVREGLVKKELIQELEILGLISAKQAELIMQQGTRSTAQLAGMQAMGGIGKGASALLGAFGGPWGIAAMLGMSMWMGYSQFEDKVKESIDNLKTSAQQKFEQLNSYLNGMGSKPQDSENLKTQVDSMKEILEQSGYYTDSIKAQVENTVKLTDQYDILKKKIEEARNASQFDVAFAGNARNAVTMSGQTDSWFGTLFGLSGKIGQITDKLGWTETGGVFGWFSGIFNDDIVKNSEQLAESLNKVSSLLMTMDSKKIEEVANQFLSAGDRTKTLEEKLRILKESGSWDGFVKKIIEGGVLTENEIESIGDKAEGLIDDINEIKDDDVPKIMGELARQRDMELDEFKIWAKDHPIAFANMLDTIMKTIGDKGPKIKELLYDAFYGFMGMSKPQEPNYNKDTYRNPIKGAFANQIKKKLYSDGTITGTDRIGKYTVKQINTYLQQVDKDTYQETGEAILKNYKQWRNEVDTMENSGIDKNSSKYKRAKWMLDLWDTIRKAGNLSEDVGKNKNTGNFGKEGSQEDAELKALRERIDAFKAFRQMYQKAKEIMPKDNAKDWAYGLFPEMKDLNPEDYIGSIEKLKKGFNFALSLERKKALTSLNREIGDWKISELLKPEFEKAAANFKEALDTQMKQWDLYKTLLEKTGSENFANLAFRNGGIFDEQAKNLVRQFEVDYKMKFPGIYANDGDAKESLEGIAGAYERWKAIADLVRNNYVKYLQDGSDAVEKTLTYAQQLDAIDTRYARRISDAKAQGNTDLVDRLNFLKNQEKSSVLLQQAKNEINWDGIFGNLDNYTRKKLKVFRKKLSVAVSKGLTDGMTTEDLQSLYDGITRLDEKIYGGTITGLGELVKELVAASKEYDDSVKEYKKALKEYGPNDYRTQNALKNMNNAENNKNRSQGLVGNKKGDILGNIAAIGDIFRTLGSGNGNGSALLGNAGAWTTSIMNMFGADKNSSKIGGIVGMFAGLTEVIGEKGFKGFLSDAFEDIGNAINSIFKDMFGINLGIGGADYSRYEDAKAEYENLIGVWDTLISRKQEYMSVHWGSEAQKAIDEQRQLLQSEIEQTKIIARERLGSGASIGSHSIWYRMWQGSYGYNGKNWRDVAPEISRKYGVKFTNMEDMLNMNRDVLQQIMMDYSGLWAMMDSDFKSYLEKLIEYGYKADDILETEMEKLTGNKFSDMVSSWADAMGTMANYSDTLVDDFENKLKNVILNSMIEEMYGEAIKSVLKQATEFAKNGDKVYGEGNKVMSEYTKEEYDIIMGGVETLAEDIEATREILRSLYGWTDNSSSSGRSSIKNITEDTADLLLSYVNAIRGDCSVTRENVRQIAQYVSSVPELSAISRSQLQRLDSIAENTLRNANMATEIRDLFKAVTNGTKKVSIS